MVSGVSRQKLTRRFVQHLARNGGCVPLNNPMGCYGIKKFTNKRPIMFTGVRGQNCNVAVAAVIVDRDEWPKEGEQASHRCHERACIHPRHICIEPTPNNRDREGCIGVLIAEDGTRHTICTHSPPCINVRDMRRLPVTSLSSKCWRGALPSPIAASLRSSAAKSPTPHRRE